MSTPAAAAPAAGARTRVTMIQALRSAMDSMVGGAPDWRINTLRRKKRR